MPGVGVWEFRVSRALGLSRFGIRRVQESWLGGFRDDKFHSGS